MRKLVTYGIMAILPIFLLILPIDHVFALTIKEQKECLSKIPPSATNAEKIAAKKKCESQSRNQAYQHEKIDEKKRLQIKTNNSLDEKILADYKKNKIKLNSNNIKFSNNIDLPPTIEILSINKDTKLKNRFNVKYEICTELDGSKFPILLILSDSQNQYGYFNTLEKTCTVFESKVKAKDPQSIEIKFYKYEKLWNLVTSRALTSR